MAVNRGGNKDKPIHFSHFNPLVFDCCPMILKIEKTFSNDRAKHCVLSWFGTASLYYNRQDINEM